MSRRVLGALVAGWLSTGCLGPPGPEWKSWNAYQLADGAAAGKTFAGMPARSLAAVAGADDGVPFRGPDYDGAPVRLDVGGPAILPAFAEGDLAAYFVTEVWQAVPEQVVQPVYAWVQSWDPSRGPMNRLRVSGGEHDGELVPTVFGVGPKSGFGSPYWEAHFTVPREGEAIGWDSARDVREVLAKAADDGIHTGPNVGCPVVPFGTRFEGVRAVRPLTLTPVKAPPWRSAWVDQALVEYVDLGMGSFQRDERGFVAEVPLYVFAAGDPAKPSLLPLPAVLARDAPANGLARRVDIWLNATDYEVFVPPGAQWARVRQGLLDQGVAVPSVDPAISDGVARAHALKVARRPPPRAGEAEFHCFDSAASLPGRCTWLDSQDAIDASTMPMQRVESDVRLSVWTVLFRGAIP